MVCEMYGNALLARRLPRYTRYRILCDTVPACRAHVHMLQFLRMREDSSRGPTTCLFYPWKQLLTNPSLCMQIETLILRALPSGFMLLYCIQLVNTYYIYTVHVVEWKSRIIQYTVNFVYCCIYHYSANPTEGFLHAYNTRAGTA